MARHWFRFGKKTKDEVAAETVTTVEESTPPDVPAVAEPEPGAASEPAKKRRRRGSRGGRGRKRSTAEATEAHVSEDGSDDARDPKAPERGKPAAAEPKKRAAERKGDRKPDRKAARSSRRRTATRRTPLPDAKRELLITVDVGEQRVAVLEDDRVAEVYLERPERRSIAGNIYLGVVDNVLPGMEAAFVEIGLEKNGFLYVDEIVGPELEGRKGARKIQDLIKRGQILLVQAVKDPMKSKGARLTTEISLPGRFLVYVPNGEGYGVSRRLEDAERTRLKEIVKVLDAKGGGIIVRTAAEGASAEDIERDLVFLQRLWKTIQAKAKQATAPELVYEEAELPLRIVRDLFAGDFVAARIDDDRTYRRIVSYLKKTSPHMIERVHRYRDKEPLFEASGVDAEIRSTLDRRVDLPSGGYLVFDYAEAFTVIDVNTGRFVGSRAKSSAGRLEDTIVKNNLEAVKEVVRQLRLRDIGGIIVIDFIDMANPKNRATVEDALRSELERDRTKTYVVEISPLGLVEMTRQNVTDGPREILTNRCPVCDGDGIVVSDATFALEVERKLRAQAKGSRVQAFRVAVHPRVLALLVGPGGERLEAIEAATRRRFFLVPAENGHIHLDHLEVLGQGKLDALRPDAPVEEGATTELKLVEIGLHDASAGVGKVDGYDVVVARAAKLVGKKVSVVVGRALDGAAYATLADGAPAANPITFEAEAEKPTRAPRPRAGIAAASEPAGEEGEDEAGGAEEGAEETVAVAEPDLVDLVDEEVDEVGVEEGSAGEGEPAKKKRTRRGSRGGRRRKKPAADGAAGAGATGNGATGNGAPPSDVEPGQPEPSAEPDAGPAKTAQPTSGRRRPRIHVPEREEPAASSPSDDGERRSVVETGAATDAEPETEGEPEVEPGPQESEVEEPGADGAPAKTRKTRRGTRGGRRRRKQPAAEDGAGQDGAAQDGAAEDSSSDDAREALESREPERARAEPEPSSAEPEPSSAEPEPTSAEPESPYVPMSEWLEDFDSGSRSGRR